MKIASVGPAASLNLLEWNEWLYQLVSALISGGAAAVSSAIVSPVVDSSHFNPWTAAYWELVGGTFLVAGLLKMCVYLQAHPLPEVKTTTKVETVEKIKPSTTVTKTVETTEVTHADSPATGTTKSTERS